MSVATIVCFVCPGGDEQDCVIFRRIGKSLFLDFLDDSVFWLTAPAFLKFLCHMSYHFIQPEQSIHVLHFHYSLVKNVQAKGNATFASAPRNAVYNLQLLIPTLFSLKWLPNDA